jgi:hypothetical protein
MKLHNVFQIFALIGTFILTMIKLDGWSFFERWILFMTINFGLGAILASIAYKKSEKE